MKDFFRHQKYKRVPGERIAAWITRWEEGLERLRRDALDIDALGDFLGWWMLEVDASLDERPHRTGEDPHKRSRKDLLQGIA